jgi:hypothetical protein
MSARGPPIFRQKCTDSLLRVDRHSRHVSRKTAAGQRCAPHGHRVTLRSDASRRQDRGIADSDGADMDELSDFVLDRLADDERRFEGR